MSNTATPTKPNGKALANVASAPIAPATQTVSQKFIARVAKQFEASMGGSISWTPLQQALGQNLYIKLDQTFTELEQKRASNFNKKNDPPITWDNVNFEKLTKDCSRCVRRELDALLDNFVQIIPYLNSRTKQYDVSIRPGYNGVDHISRRFALDPILDIKYQLVHETDVFEVKIENGIEMPYFKQTSPFKPGNVIGGYGYIMYDDPRKNRLYICEYREFEKAKNASPGVEFWGGIQSKWVDGEDGKRKKVDGEYDEKFEKEMQRKTLMYRVNATVKLDPAKINVVELYHDLDSIEEGMIIEVAENANKESLSLSENSSVGEKASIQQTQEQQSAAVQTQGQSQEQPNLEEEADF